MWPVLPAYVPVEHLVQPAEPATEYVPAAQLVQLRMLERAEYVPAAQLKHTTPSPDLYMPAGQSVQPTEPLSENLPSAHLAHTEEPGVEVNLPTAQLTQLVLPRAAV